MYILFNLNIISVSLEYIYIQSFAPVFPVFKTASILCDKKHFFLHPTGYLALLVNNARSALNMSPHNKIVKNKLCLNGS